MDALTGLPRQHKLLLATAGLGVFVVALLFLDWYGPLGVTDVADSWWVALLLAVVAGAFYVAEALRLGLPVDWVTPPRALIATGLVAFWTLTHLIDGAELGVGAWLALIGSGAGLLGAWLVDVS